MLSLVKPYLTYIAVALIAGVLAYSHFKAYQAGEAHIQEKFDTYKENIHDQVQKSLIEKTKIETEQNVRYTMAQTGYAGAIDELNRRLLDAKTMPWNCGVPVAGSSGSAVPGEAKDPSGTLTALAVGGGVCDSDFYAKALREHVQCRQLIDLVK